MMNEINSSSEGELECWMRLQIHFGGRFGCAASKLLMGGMFETCESKKIITE